MLFQSTVADFDSFSILPDSEGLLKNHWDWPLLSLSPDCGADMVCMVFFLQFFAMFNLTANWDPAHMLNTQVLWEVSFLYAKGRIGGHS